MARSTTLFSALLILGLAGVFQSYVYPIIKSWGLGRTIEEVGSERCKTVPGLQACEKITLHQASGTLYLACSTPVSRTYWMPPVGRLNASGASYDDYVAVYEPASGSYKRLVLEQFKSSRGLSVHGMDVVPSSSNPSELYVYLVNHRNPLHEQAEEVGADSVIEVFKTKAGSSSLLHLYTMEDSVIDTPNDIAGSADGLSFYFTNDHGSKTGFIRRLEMIGLAVSSVGYCHVRDGCKIAKGRLPRANGITTAANGTLYVANSVLGEVRVFRIQENHSLQLLDLVSTDRGIDNLSLDHDGHLWAAGFPDRLKHMNILNDPLIPVPSSALRISSVRSDTGSHSRVYTVTKMFENSGDIASDATSAAYDSQRNRLFLHGVAAPHLAVCEL